jgi:hypothetical protein
MMNDAAAAQVQIDAFGKDARSHEHFWKEWGIEREH